MKIGLCTALNTTQIKNRAIQSGRTVHEEGIEDSTAIFLRVSVCGDTAFHNNGRQRHTGAECKAKQDAERFKRAKCTAEKNIITQCLRPAQSRRLTLAALFYSQSIACLLSG